MDDKNAALLEFSGYLCFENKWGQTITVNFVAGTKEELVVIYKYISEELR
jgi:hypothetical protein